MQGQVDGQLTLFPEDSHASRFPLPGSGEARRMTVTSGQKWSGLSRSSGPLGWLEKTLLESSIWHSTLCYLTWVPKATPHGHFLFQLRASVPHTRDTGQQSWPTPTAADSYTGNLKSTQQKPGSRHSVNLSDAVRMWPTQKASDCNGSGPAGSKSAEHDLMKGHLKGAVMYPTPTVGSLCGGKHAQESVQKLADEEIITQEEFRSMQAGNGGQLNPEWVEWLMGFPIGWTDCAALETQ